VGKLISLAAVVALVVAAAPAAANAAKGIPYNGKTTGGHKVTFNYDGKAWAHDFVTGVPMQCISIQGGGAPMTGAEVWNFKNVKLGLKNYQFSEQSKPSLYYNEVTRNHRVTITRPNRKRVVRGSIRVQYEFLIPKYPIGTFSIYSCLGHMKFSARPTR
jgi:hypothetical protein